MERKDTAPATGQQPGTLLQVIDSPCNDINPSSDGALIWFLDIARPGGKCVRYLSDARPGPGAGLWRTYGGFPPERISPFAITRITPGRHGIEVELELELVLPQNGNVWSFEGSIDTVATLLWRAGQGRGVRGDRQALFWALYDLCAEIRRQQAARGGC